MTIIYSEIYDISILIFIVAATLHVVIIVLNIKEFRVALGNHIQIAIRQYKTGGIKGKLFAISLLIIILCFLFWMVVAMIK